MAKSLKSKLGKHEEAIKDFDVCIKLRSRIS